MCRWQLRTKLLREAGFPPPTREEADAIWAEHQRECDMCPFTRHWWICALAQVIGVALVVIWFAVS